jgi:hypothetical protein
VCAVKEQSKTTHQHIVHISRNIIASVFVSANPKHDTTKCVKHRKNPPLSPYRHKSQGVPGQLPAEQSRNSSSGAPSRRPATQVSKASKPHQQLTVKLKFDVRSGAGTDTYTALQLRGHRQSKRQQRNKQHDFVGSKVME